MIKFNSNNKPNLKMKNPIEIASSVAVDVAIKNDIAYHEQQIAKHKAQVERLSKVLELYRGTRNAESKAQSGILVKMSKRTRRYRRRNNKKHPNQHWSRIMELIKRNGKPMSAKQMIKILYKGKRKTTQAKMERRLVIWLSNQKAKGSIISVKTKKGEKLIYGTPDMGKFLPFDKK
jgi:hypothetical protein